MIYFGSKNKGKILLAWCILLSAWLLGCTKNKDQLNKPKAEILSPQEFTAYQLPDTLKVRIKASDQNWVTKINVSLLDDAGILVAEPTEILTDNPAIETELDLVMNDTSSAGGPHTIRLTVWNADNQSETDFLKVQLTPVPRILIGYLVTTKTGSANSTLNMFSPTLQDGQTYNIGGTLTDGVFWSKNQRFNYILGKQSQYRSYNLKSQLNSLVYSIPNPTGFEFLTALSASNSEVYFTSRETRVLGFNIDNNSFYSYNPIPADYIPTWMQVFNQKLYVFSETISPPKQFRMQVLDRNFQRILGERIFLTQPVRLENHTDGLILFSNNSDRGAVSLLDSLQLSYFEARLLPVNVFINDVARINQNLFYLATNHGIYTYSRNTNTLLPVASFSGDFVSIEYNELNDVIALAESKQLGLYSRNNHQPLYQKTLSDSITGLWLRYNR